MESVHDERRILILLENEKGQRARHASVAVRERMNFDEAMMQPRRFDDRMDLGLRLEVGVQREQAIHFGLHLLRRRALGNGAVLQAYVVGLGLPFAVNERAPIPSSQ